MIIFCRKLKYFLGLEVYIYIVDGTSFMAKNGNDIYLKVCL